MRHTLVFWCAALTCFGAVWGRHHPKAYLLPTSTSKPVFEIQDRSRLEIDHIEGNWAHVTYGLEEGWVIVSEVLVFPKPREIDFGRSDSVPQRDFSQVDVQTWGGRWQGLLQFATEEERKLSRVTDPVARRKIQETNREWGRLFVFKTPLYRAQGFRLYSFMDRRWSINLAQGRARSRDWLGQALSDSLEEEVLDGNRGILGNRALFKRGRSYLLELRYDF